MKDVSQKESNEVDWVEGMRIQPEFTIKKELSAPPKPLTEASLLGLMEKHSLGTPATRAEIIEKLIKSELMERTPQGLQVSPKGKQLLELVNPSLVTPDLTESWEKDLEAIAAGQKQASQFLMGIEKETKRLVQEIKTSKQSYQDFSITQKNVQTAVPILEKILEMAKSMSARIKIVITVEEKIQSLEPPLSAMSSENGDHQKAKMALISVVNMMGRPKNVR